MEKEMTRLLNYLKVEYFLLWILCAATVLLYEMDILPQGIFVDDPRADYILQVVGILLTVGLIPVSLRLFSLSLTKYIKQLNLMDALKSYRRWNEVRIALLLVPALINLSIYYWTMNTTGLLCVGMVLIASMFYIPGRERMLNELDLQDKQ